MIIFNEAKPKYEKLDSLLEEKLMDVRLGTQINIIVDLKEIAKKFFRPDVCQDNYEISQLCEEITSDIFSIVGHYRNYFFKKGKYTNFFFLNNIGKHEMPEYPSYNKEFEFKYVYSDETKDTNPDSFRALVLSKVVRACEKGLPMFPHVYVIKSFPYGDTAYCKSLISNLKTNELNIVITNDSALFPLVSGNTVILTPKGIKSELVTPENVFNILTKKDEDIPFSSAMLPLVLSLSGLKKHSIEGIKGVALGKGLKIVESLITSGKIIDAPSVALPFEFTDLDPALRTEKILIENADIITDNYNLICAEEILSKHKLVIQTAVTPINRMYNINDIKKLNDVVFKNHPLQLDMMLKGEKI